MNTPDSRWRRLLGHGPGLLWAMVAGGLLWMVHGYLRFLTPQGPDAVWREDLQYSQILSTPLFLMYSLPGVLALLLSSWAALSFLPTLATGRTGLRRAARIFALLAFVFGLVAAVGQVVLFVSPTIGGISFGVPSLGLALFLAGLAAGREGGADGRGPHRFVGLWMMLLGGIGMLTLPVQPLVYALELLPLTFATAVFALFGAGWIGLAFTLRTETAPAAQTL
ncbi:hypothetical protein F8G81_06275 [Arthrobacter sp. CDRTa11]|uniref:hypothetical protein n=1 Tax=Arthrobacter sp. CDRTa11 TaxID=2651199 RepID=UPI002265B280|nr:hypothetical protein [Arthrobacter sp. CDRTa11]UZX02266.1 hypothetical protein F8G81_06275 [Arthrobacter sp. CDRTa11]